VGWVVTARPTFEFENPASLPWPILDVLPHEECHESAQTTTHAVYTTADHLSPLLQNPPRVLYSEQEICVAFSLCCEKRQSVKTLGV
jgi:hypothetical protein